MYACVCINGDNWCHYGQSVVIICPTAGKCIAEMIGVNMVSQWLLFALQQASVLLRRLMSLWTVSGYHLPYSVFKAGKCIAEMIGVIMDSQWLYSVFKAGKCIAEMIGVIMDSQGLLFALLCVQGRQVHC